MAVCDSLKSEAVQCSTLADLFAGKSTGKLTIRSDSMMLYLIWLRQAGIKGLQVTETLVYTTFVRCVTWVLQWSELVETASSRP